ncbi:hypothetical protein PIB30_069210, partial [Stylosanthes scabra]|nr:hypothetical protein [Stylosanthes scabra]
MRKVDYDSNNNNVREALLLKNKKQYYENCPGCKVDQVKDMNHAVSVKNLLIIWMIVLCATLPISSLFPFLYFMVRDFNIAETEADIGSYAGYVGSTFMLGRCLTSVMWGIISDRYGRKPVIIIGVITVVIFNTLFGLSTSFWMAILMRFLLGSLNGLLGPVKAYATEIFREEHQSLGLSTETLHNHKDSNELIDYAEAIENGSSLNNKDDNNNMIEKKENLLLNWPLMSSIIAYCVFSLHDIAYQEVFSLWAVAPSKLGGLSFTTDIVGDVLAVSGISLIIYQILLYPSVERACGPIGIARISGVLSIPLLQSFSFMTMLSGTILFIVICVASILKNLLAVTITTGLFLIQNRVVEQHQRGAANGLSMTAMSLFKAIGPAAGGAV